MPAETALVRARVSLLSLMVAALFGDICCGRRATACPLPGSLRVRAGTPHCLFGHQKCEALSVGLPRLSIVVTL